MNHGAAALLWLAIALAGQEPEVRPQDDLYLHVNARWLAEAEIPADRVQLSTFVELEERASTELRTLIEEIAARAERRKGSQAQQIADLYASLMDERTLERLGASPLRPVLDRIESAASPRELASAAGHLGAIGSGGLFAVELVAGAGPEAGPVAQVALAGALLPEPRYYLSDEPAFRESRSRYEAYLTRVFTLLGRGNPGPAATAVLALETELARAQAAGAGTAPRRFTLSELKRAMPGFDWTAWAGPQGLDRVSALVLLQPALLERFARLAASAPLDAWRAWLVARYVTDCAPFLSDAFADARFDLFGRLLSGQELPRTRWKRGVSLVNGYLGDALGRVYVERRFSATTRARAQALVANVLEAQRRAVQQADWIGAGTRREALHKLSRLRVRVGWPDAWHDYRGLDIRPDELLANIQRAKRLASSRGGDGTWAVPPQTANAAYDPARNEILLPAAVLQPPLFDPAADDALNYGAIGAVLGHELTHAFVGRGAGIDGDGVRRAWWAPSDEQALAARVGRTAAESVADLAGLSVAFAAYTASLRGQRSPVIDGRSGEQRFFIGWARTWRARVRDEYLKQWSSQAPHAQPQQRVNDPVSHLAAFHEAFGVRPGDKLYRAPAERSAFW
jgi:predicted metalloendopeptidase